MFLGLVIFAHLLEATLLEFQMRGSELRASYSMTIPEVDSLLPFQETAGLPRLSGSSEVLFVEKVLGRCLVAAVFAVEGDQAELFGDLASTLPTSFG